MREKIRGKERVRMGAKSERGAGWERERDRVKRVSDWESKIVKKREGRWER